jgi:hypothetical protein
MGLAMLTYLSIILLSLSVIILYVTVKIEDTVCDINFRLLRAEKKVERMIRREELEKMRQNVNKTEINQMPPPGEANKCPLCSGSGVNNNLVLTDYPSIYPKCINCEGSAII